MTVTILPLLKSLLGFWKVGRLLVVVVAGWLTKGLLRKHFERSHAAYIKRRFGAHWEPLTENTEYVLHWVSGPMSDNGRVSEIFVRRRPGSSVNIRTLSVRIETSGGYVGRHQENQVFHDVSDEPICRSLRDLPEQHLRAGDRGIQLSVATYSVLVNSVDPPTERPNHRAASNHAPTYTDYLNGKWVHLWGRWWNLDLYAWACDEMNDILRYCLLKLDERLGYPWLELRGGWLRRGLAWFLTRRLVFWGVFWSALLLRVVDVDDEGRLVGRISWLSTARVARLVRGPDPVLRARRT